MHFGARFFIGSLSVLLAVFAASWFVSFKKQLAADASPVAAVPIVQASQDAVDSGMSATAIPKVVSISPQDGSQDVMLDIEDPVKVGFDGSMKEFFVDFRLDPPVEVMYENNPEKTEFKLLPKTPLRLASQYTLNIFVKRRGMDDGSYTQLARSAFSTPKEKLTAEQQTVADILAIAKRDTVPQVLQGRYIDVTLSSQVMILFEDGKPVDAYRVSSGKRGMETPKGRFKIENKAKRVWSKTYGLYMPYWMAITPNGKYGIHELPEWPGGYKEGASHIGHPVSHGCVRLGVGSAQRAWEWTEVGTPVIVH